MKISNALPYLMLIASAPSIMDGILMETIGLTTVWWLVFAFFFGLVLKYKKFFFAENHMPFWIQLFILMVIIQTLHGVFIGQGYWDYKLLARNFLAYLLPLSLYVFLSPILLRNTLKVWFRYALVAFFLVAPLLTHHTVGMYLVPLMFMMLFLKALPNSQKITIFVFLAIMFLFSSLDARSIIIKYTAALLTGLSLYTDIYRLKGLLRSIHVALMILPLLLFSLGITGVFNVFNMREYTSALSQIEIMDNSTGKVKTGALDADTRTLLYVEVITSAVKHNYIWEGHSLARGYESRLFGEVDSYGRGERGGSEVGILNIFTYFGIFGVLIYFAIFFTASYKAVSHSNNRYIRALGLFVAFRWVFAWIEDVNKFNLDNLLLWIMIGMCYSKIFRSMNNSEFKIWVSGIMSQRPFRFARDIRPA